MLDLESWGPGSIPTGGKYHILFLSFVKLFYILLPDMAE